MRISTFQLHTQTSQQLQTIGAQAARTQQQISSGKRLVDASDNPIGAARVVSIGQDEAVRERFIANVDAADIQLALEDSVLKRVSDLIQRVQELTLQAGSGIQTQDDRQYIASEVRARFDELLALSNTQSVDGQYLFSGYQTDGTPFEMDGGAVVYRGDEGTRALQVSREQSVQVSNNGYELFMDVPVSTVQLVESYRSSETGSIENFSVIDQEAASAFFPEQLVVEFRPLAEAAGASNFTIKRQSDGRVIGGMANIAYTGADVVEVEGIRFTIAGSPQVGDQFVLSTSNEKSLFETVNRVAQGLEEIDASQDPEGFQAMIDQTIEGLDAATDRVLEIRADVGTRMNSIDSARDMHEDMRLRLAEMRAEIVDLDFAEAVSRLAFESFVLEAAQQSFVRISGLSLFNRL